jgi:hypothetical protein
MKIELINFGQHELLNLETTEEAVLFVVGKNRVGKSTIRDAIEFALLGTCKIRGFSLKRDVWTYMIREDQSQAQVTLNMGSWTVRRSISRGGSSKIEVQVSELVGFVEFNAEQWNERFLRAEPDAVRVALDAEQFYRMDDKSRRKLLMSVKDSERTTAKQVFDALGEALTGYASEDPGREKMLDKVIHTAVSIGFEQANARAVEYRRGSKRQVSEMGERAKTHVFGTTNVEGIDITQGETWQHESKVEQIKAEVLEVRRLLARAEGGAEERLKSLQWRLEHLRVELPKAKLRFLEDGRSLDGDEAFRFFDEQKEEALAAQTKCLEHIASNLQKMQELEDEREALESGAAVGEESLAGSPDQCPAVSFKMKCPAKPQTFAKAFEKSKLSTVVEGTRTLEDIDGEISDRVTQQQANNKHLAEERDNYRGLETRQQVVVSSLANHETIKSEISEVVEAIELAEEEAKTQSTIHTYKELELMEERLRVGTLVTTARKEWERAQLEQEKTEKSVAAALLDVSWWDEIEKQLRPDGIEASLASLATSEFSDALKECDRLAEVRVSDDMVMSINGRHISSCSKSEQLCGGIALQAAMSSKIGLPLLVVDEVDKLDVGWKRELTGWVGGAGSKFPGGVVAMATSDADPPGCPPDGFITAWIRPGMPTLCLGGDFEAPLPRDREEG